MPDISNEIIEFESCFFCQGEGNCQELNPPYRYKCHNCNGTGKVIKGAL